MFKTIRNIFKIPDLRKRILYTLLMLAICRLGCLIPSPFVKAADISAAFKGTGDLLEFFDLMSGSAFSQMNLFAMGIQPYINASIIMNLLCVAIPALEEIQKDGESGQKKINQYTRYITIGLALVQSFGIAYSLKSYFNTTLGTAWTIICAMIIFTAGSMFVMWVGECITEKGIGNGISLIIMVNVLSGLPTSIANVWGQDTSKFHWIAIVVMIVLLAMVIFIVILELAERRVHINYAQRMRGRKSYGGGTNYIPIRVNMAGVIPIIFASSIQTMPQLITNFITTDTSDTTWGTILKWLSTSHPFGACLYVVLIVLFTYFYASITFNPLEVSENLKKNGGMIPGFRPGKETTEYLKKTAHYVTTIGAICLALVAVLPVAMQLIFGFKSLTIGGSSLMIVVGVALELVKAIDSKLTVRSYSGFLSDK